MKLAESIKQWKKKQSPLVLRILAVNLFSLLLISLFNYLAFYNSNNKAFIDSVTAYNDRVSGIAFANIDKQIMQRAAEIPSMFFSDIRTNDSILLPQTTDISGAPSQIVALRNRINEIRSACPVVHSVDVLYESSGTIVCGTSNIHFDYDDAERDRYLPWYRKFKESGRDAIILPLSNDVYPNKTQSISFVTRIKNFKWQGKGIVLALHISPENFAEYIDEQQGRLVIEANDGTILYSTPGTNTAPEELAAAVKAELTEQELSEGKTIKLDAVDAMVSVAVSPTLGIRYYHALPYNIFFKDYNSHVKTLILYYIVSVLFTMGILLLISQLNNTIYRKRLDAVSKKAGLELSAADRNFDRSADMLTSQLSSLNTVVQQVRPVLHTNYVRSLILGRRADDAYKHLLPILGYSGIFCMIINLTPQDSAMLDLVVLEEQLADVAPPCRMLMTTLEKNEIAILISTDKEASREVRDVMNQRLEAVFTGHYAADGQWFELSEKNLKESFDSAANIYRYHFIFPDKSRLHYEKIGPVQTKNYGSHLKLFAEIEKNILSENLFDLKQKLYALTESFKFGSYSIDYCSSTLRDLVTMLYNITQSRQLDMWVAFGYDIRAHYKQINDIDEFYRWSCDLCEVLMQNIRQRKKGINPDLQSQLITLINQNLENNISLEFLADTLALRPDVLSRTFRQLMGKSYIDYIKERKLTRAKELIAEGHSMKDISMRLGYNSTQYFIKIFKETYGVTPYQYKKNGMPAE